MLLPALAHLGGKSRFCLETAGEVYGLRFRRVVKIDSRFPAQNAIEVGQTAPERGFRDV